MAKGTESLIYSEALDLLHFYLQSEIKIQYFTFQMCFKKYDA